MVKNILTSITIVIFLGSFSSVAAQTNKKTKPKFIDDIEISMLMPAASESVVKVKGPSVDTNDPYYIEDKSLHVENSKIENVSTLQFKYSLLLNTEVEQVKNLGLFSLIDEWFGTPYRLGGESKNGIDCSAFVQVIYAGLFGISVPRTAREQFKATRKISRTEIKEGDLVFFNTIGGVSHVGIYLQNNKFVHAASSGGVMISDLYDDYWAKRFIGVGRHDDLPNNNTFFSQP
jgi:lipoprotein Spr